MTLIDKVEAITTNITKANILWAQMEPLKKEFEELAKPLVNLDKSKNYFGVKADGNAYIVSFDPQSGMPQFREAIPLPEEEFAASEAAQAEADRLTDENSDDPINVVPLGPLS